MKRYIKAYNTSYDPTNADVFLIEGYYDTEQNDLAESYETSDISALNELTNDFANKGYYIVLRNLDTGTVTEFTSDSWFEYLTPDGIMDVIEI